ncbi:MAG TPA: hypothetical protein VG847_12840, partial [Chitinophagaceae bacterium]|nr:hypothetical protein [Chitinophagaceae bacterium]
ITNILLGHDKDVLKKTNNGFVIDYVEKKDTSYTDALGAVHRAISNIQYHVTISRRKSHHTTMNYLKEENYFTILPSFICKMRSLI